MRQRWNTVSAEVACLAQDVGWRSVFFTNKPQEDPLPDSESEENPSVGSEEEPPPETLNHPDPSCDADPGPEGGSDSIQILSDLMREDLSFCEEEPDCSTDTLDS